MDKNGYVLVSELLQKINITMEELEASGTPTGSFFGNNEIPYNLK